MRVPAKLRETRRSLARPCLRRSGYGFGCLYWVRPEGFEPPTRGLEVGWLIPRHSPTCISGNTWTVSRPCKIPNLPWFIARSIARIGYAQGSEDPRRPATPGWSGLSVQPSDGPGLSDAGITRMLQLSLSDDLRHTSLLSRPPTELAGAVSSGSFLQLIVLSTVPVRGCRG
jgi:hypothetical protein